MATPDLTVRGGGIFGLSVAWAASRRGARVRLIETNRIGAGSSGGLVGALAPHVPENWNDKKAFQLDSLLMAQDWWGAVSQAAQLDTGYARLGRLQSLDDDRAVDLAHTRIDGAARLWRGEAAWQVIRSDGLAWAPASATGWVIHDTLTARLHPRLAAAALVAAIRAKGGEVMLGEADDHGPVVWATGYAGLLALGNDLGQAVGSGVKGQALLLAHDVRNEPQLFTDGLHIIPHADGTVAVGSTSETVWDAPDSTDTRLDALHHRAIAACPSLASAQVIERWSGIRPRAKSRAPMLGEWPGRPGHFIANGGFKIGFGMAPKVAEVMADLVLDGHDAIPRGFRVDASY